MVITHVRGEGIATDAELEALSLYMGHSDRDEGNVRQADAGAEGCARDWTYVGHKREGGGEESEIAAQTPLYYHLNQRSTRV